MAEKTLNTRILLKYDTYTNWTTKNPVLKAGELAIATIPSDDTQNTQTVNSVTKPQILIKVGDGSSNYNDLKFISGLAADVHTWAKAATKPSYSASEISGLADFISGEIQDTDTQYNIVKLNDYNYKFQKKDKNASTYTDVITITIPKYTLPVATTSVLGGVKIGSNVSIAADGTISLTKENVTAALGYTPVNPSDIANYEIKKLDTAEPGYLASYQLEKDGAKAGDVINIPKDYLVKSASCKTATADNTPIEGLKIGDPYLDFVINTKDTDTGSGTEGHVYINVADLVDTYTAGDNVTITGNEISVDLSGKVDKVAGKGLIANEFANAVSVVDGKVFVETDLNFNNAYNLNSVGIINAGSLSTEDGIESASYVKGYDVWAYTDEFDESGRPNYIHKLSEKANDADISAIGKSGNINDLVQTTGDTLIFNCGNATI